MCKNYRKIYEQHYGSIPIDEYGRSYEIHHKDGNHDNNSPENLLAVTIQEHYNIHYAQKDYAACLLIMERMSVTVEEKSKMAKLSALKRVEEGTHPFLGNKLQRKRLNEGTHNFINLQNKLVEEGRHHFLGGDIARRISRKRVEEGTHHWQTVMHSIMSKNRQEQKLQSNSHNFQKTFICDCGCDKTYNAGNYKRHKIKKLKSLTNV